MKCFRLFFKTAKRVQLILFSYQIIRSQKSEVQATNNNFNPIKLICNNTVPDQERRPAVLLKLSILNTSASCKYLFFIFAGTWTTFGGIGGCNSEETAEAVVALAYDSGINVFDLSEAHSGHRAETELGRILLRRAWRRSSYVVTTKIYWNTK